MPRTPYKIGMGEAHPYFIFHHYQFYLSSSARSHAEDVVPDRRDHGTGADPGSLRRVGIIIVYRAARGVPAVHGVARRLLRGVRRSPARAEGRRYCLYPSTSAFSV